MDKKIYDIKQFVYMEKIANAEMSTFMQQGYATPGNNGPHGHVDSPVRNSAHFLIIYSFLYKLTGNTQYSVVSKMLAEYIYNKQAESSSGAIECMLTDKFDHLNGLIGQAWVIEGLLYYCPAALSGRRKRQIKFGDFTCLTAQSGRRRRSLSGGGAQCSRRCHSLISAA